MHRKDFLKTGLLLPLLSLTGTIRAAADKGTPDEAEALVRKAAAYIKAHGSEKGYEELTHGKAFKDRDLYVFVFDFNGKCLAHGANPKLIGKDLMGLKDADGKPLVRMTIDIAKDKGQGWTAPVKFRNPVTDKIQTRVSYIERLGDTAIGSGVYQD